MIEDNYIPLTKPTVKINGEEIQERESQIGERMFLNADPTITTSPCVVTMESDYEDANIRYTVSGRSVTKHSLQYRGPINIYANESGSDNTVIKARVYRNDGSHSSTATFELIVNRVAELVIQESSTDDGVSIRDGDTTDYNDVSYDLVTYEAIVLDISEEVNMSPNAGRTIYSFSELLTSNISLNCNVSNCKIGDEIVMIVIAGEGGEIAFPSETFFLNWSEDNTFVPAHSRAVLLMTFDGEKFVHSFENC